MTASAERFSTHADPVWRQRADFIINARLPEPGRFEQLWARRVSEARFEICCIPFFLYDVALGDVVETVAEGHWQHRIERVLSRSGRFVFRAYFERRQYRHRDSTGEAMHALGAQTEWSSPSLLAIDVEGSSVQKIADVLEELEHNKTLTYETEMTA